MAGNKQGNLVMKRAVTLYSLMNWLVRNFNILLSPSLHPDFNFVNFKEPKNIEGKKCLLDIFTSQHRNVELESTTKAVVLLEWKVITRCSSTRSSRN